MLELRRGDGEVVSQQRGYIYPPVSAEQSNKFIIANCINITVPDLPEPRYRSRVCVASYPREKALKVGDTSSVDVWVLEPPHYRTSTLGARLRGASSQLGTNQVAAAFSSPGIDTAGGNHNPEPLPRARASQ